MSDSSEFWGGKVTPLVTSTRFEQALREDARVSDADRVMAAKLLAGAAFSAEVSPSRPSRRRVPLPLTWAVAAAACLVATGFASARIIDRMNDLEPVELAPSAKAIWLAPPATVPRRPDMALAVAPAPVPRPVTKPEEDARPALAAELFGTANRARDQRLTAQAERLYLRLQTRFPRSSEAQLSLVSLGRLRLDAGRPLQALAAFDAYLARAAAGPMQHEALAGRALALEKLARPEDEARAWRTLLESHPESLFQARAKARLRVLAPSP